MKTAADKLQPQGAALRNDVLCRVLAFLSTVWLFGFNAAAASPDAAEFYVNAMWRQKEQLQVCDVLVRFERSLPSIGIEERLEVRLHANFPSRSFKMEDFRKGKLAFQSIITPDNTFVRKPGSGAISKYATGASGIPMEAILTIDPRAIGLVGVEGFFHETYPAIKENLSKRPVQYDKNLRDGLGALIWDYTVGDPVPEKGQLEVRKVIFVDETVGFQPVRLEQYVRWAGEEFSDPELIASIDYSKVNGLWLPVSCKTTQFDGKTPIRAEISLEWHSVNTPFALNFFTPEGLNAPGGTIVLNQRIGADKGVIESVIPRDGIDDLPGGSYALTHSEAIDGKRSNFLLVAINVFVVILLIALLVFRRRLAS